jgi:predicted RNase H-like nuclease (RuvC/YqgF family)
MAYVQLRALLAEKDAEIEGWHEHAERLEGRLADKDAEIERLRTALESADGDQRQAVREAIRLRGGRCERLRTALRIAIGWSYGNAVTPEQRDRLERLLDV